MTAAVRTPQSAAERQAAAPPAAAADQWVALGPATVTRGRAVGLPRVAGRVTALAVSPDGLRAYAGTALGGVWYSADAGEHWMPLDFYTSTLDAATPPQLQHTDALTVGAIGVIWGTAATDQVFVGAREHPTLGLDRGAATLQGVGIRSATGPAASVTPSPLPAAPTAVGAAAVDPWRVESPDLIGLAVNQLTPDLVTAGVMWAATSRGLYRRTPPVPPVGGAAAVPATWVRVAIAALGDVELTAIVSAAGVTAGEAQRLYAATATGRVVWSTDGVAWTEIVLPAFPEAEAPAATPITRMRLAIANGPTHPVVYALGEGPRLWRIDVIAPARVGGVPRELTATDPLAPEPFGLAIAGHPASDAAHQDMIVLGGQTLTLRDRPRQAALYVATVRNTVAGWAVATAGLVDGAPAEWVGQGVPAGVHAVRWIAVGAATHLWLGGDGGVFRSTADGTRGSFKERNTGLAAIEVTSLAQAGDIDGMMLVGTRGNGLLQRRGPAAWNALGVSPELGPIGAVAIDPANARNVYVKGKGTDWRKSEDGGATFAEWKVRTALSTHVDATRTDKAAEDDGAASVTRLGLLSVPDDPRGTLKALGTNRVWYVDDERLERKGASLTGWVTLPTGTDPYAAAAPAIAQDRLDGPVLSCVWGSKDRLFVLTTKSVYLFDRNGAGWQPYVKLYDQAVAMESHKFKRPPLIPPDLSPVSLAVRNAATGQGTLYVGTAGPGDKSHLWYHDGGGKWYTTNFMRDTPIYAIVVDPEHDDVVYVATRAGVFRGAGTSLDTANPQWTWTQFSSGLPEAPCVDLALYVRPDVPAAGAPAGVARRMLRAALAGRGVWEVPLDNVQQGPMVYLRAQEHDTRRFDLPKGGARNPVSPSRDQLRLDASPDIRVRRRSAVATPARAIAPSVPLAMQAPSPPPPPPPAPPPPVYDRFNIDASSDAYDVWLMHSALRAVGEDVDPDAEWSAASAAARTRQAAALVATPPARTPTRIWNTLVGTGLGVDRAMDAADLAVWVRDEPDRWPKGARTSCASDNLVTVHIAVHSRHWRPFAANTVQVALLMTRYGLPAAGATPARSARPDLRNVPPLPAGWAAAVTAANALPAGAWDYADPVAANRLRPVATQLDPNNPGVVRFDLDLAGASWDKPGWLLLAVVIAPGDPLNTAETDVATLVRTDHHVAARSVRNAATLPRPLERYPGMDRKNYPGAALMDGAWPKSNLYFTGAYLESPRPVVNDSVAGNTHDTGTEVVNLSRAVNAAAVGWTVGDLIAGPGIPAAPPTTIAGIAADGRSLTLSAPATTSTRGAALTVTAPGPGGAARPGATGDVLANTIITKLITNVGPLGWVAAAPGVRGTPIGGTGIPAGAIIAQILPDNDDPWIRMTVAATATARVQLFTISGNINAGTPTVMALSENVTDRGWRIGMPIEGDGIPAGTTIQGLPAGGNVTLSQNATLTIVGVALRVGERLQTAQPPQPTAGHARYRGLRGMVDEAWMGGWRALHGDWGIAPIYWGQQAIGNDSGPSDLRRPTATFDMARENARDAVSKAIRADIPPGATIYLDWEKSRAPTADGADYCARFFRALQEYGYRAGVYCFESATTDLTDLVPGLLVWNVNAAGGTTAQQPGDLFVEGGLFMVKVESLAAGALMRQWRFGSTLPAVGHPIPGFNAIDIDLDVGSVFDPAFPERQFIPGQITGGRVAVAPHGGAESLVFGVRGGDAKVVRWTAPGPSAAHVPRLAADTVSWWNPLAAIAALRLLPEIALAPAANHATDVLLAIGMPRGVESAPDKVQARGEWRIIAARCMGAGPWTRETIPSAGVAIDPLPGVVAVTRGDRSIDAFVVDDDSGELLVSRWDPAGVAYKSVWSPLAPLSTPTGATRRTNRAAAVSRDTGIADVFWVRPTIGAGVPITTATFASPIAVTTGAPHGLATGQPVLITGVPPVPAAPGPAAPGNIAANGVFTVTVTALTTFTLDESRGSGAPAPGGLATPVDGRIYTSSSVAATPTQWTAPTQIGAANVRAHPFANLVAVSAAAGRMDVLFVGRADGTADWVLHDINWTVANGWVANANVGGPAVRVAAPSVLLDPLVPIAACSRTATTVDAFVVGRDGALYVTTLDTGTNAWTAFVAIAAPAGTRIVRVESAARLGADGAIVVVTTRLGAVFTSTRDPGTAAYRPLAATDLNA